MRHAAALLTLLLGVAAPAARVGAADGGGAAWEWLSSADARPDAARIAPALTDAEQAVALGVWRRSVWTIANTPEGDPPRAGAADAAAYAVSTDGVLATAWRVVAMPSVTTGRTWLWAREPGGEWLRAIPVGATWLADVGLVRVVGAKRRTTPPAFGVVDKTSLGKRFVAVGTALGRDNVITAATLTSMEWFDAASQGGRFECRATQLSRHPPKDGALLALRFPESFATRGSIGNVVLTPEGACIGFVAWNDAARAPSDRVVVRPLSLARPAVDRLVADGGLSLADLGLRFGPPPSAPGTAGPLPVDLERLRGAKDSKEKGGALVASVLDSGPALGLVWPGDLVLEIDKKPVFGDVYESFAAPLFALKPAVPADLVLWRSGKRVTVQIVAQPMNAIYPSAQEEHDARATSLLFESRETKGDSRR